MIDIIQVMRQKSQDPQGNTYVILCNERFYDHFQAAMREIFKVFQPTDTIFFSKTDGKMKLDVGANFESYHYGGNTISVVVDKAMSDEYGQRGYGVVLDITPDRTSQRPAMELFTLQGADMLTGTLRGLGGTDGKSSGEVATMLHGSGYAVMGYSGAALYNPYRSFIIQENVYYAF